MFLRVRVSAVGREKVNYPAERADRPDPGRARHDQPDQTDNNSPVINLSESGNQKAQQPCYKRIMHFFTEYLRPSAIREGGRDCSQQSGRWPVVS